MLPQTILACSEDGAFRLQLCKLLLDSASSCPEGWAAFRALLPVMRESSSAARALAGALGSALASSAPSGIPADALGCSEAPGEVILVDALLNALSRDVQPCVCCLAHLPVAKGDNSIFLP